MSIPKKKKPVSKTKCNHCGNYRGTKMKNPMFDLVFPKGVVVKKFVILCNPCRNEYDEEG